MNTAFLANELLRDEGIRLRVYPDSKGIPTIGVGRNLQDRGITRSEAMALLDNDITLAVAELDRALPWWRQQSEARQRVLANMMFNLGANRLLQFKDTLAFIQAGQFSQAADEMLRSAWAQQVGVRAVRLSDMMRSG